MNVWEQIIGNPIFVSAVLGWAVAQVIKFFLYLIINKKIVWERLIGNGGMPSSHSATVCAMATATAIYYGYGGFEFAMATIFAIVVMTDAMGVRYETGKQAVILNDMMDMFREMENWDWKDPTARLKEFVGHTPLQILVGAILGICVSLAYNL